MTTGTYTDAETGIKLSTWSSTSPAAFTFGMALPADALTKDATEYIGLLVGSKRFLDRNKTSSLTPV